MRWIRLSATLMGLAMTAAACGGSAGASGAGDEEPSPEDARLAFADCMREHGVDIDDPEEGGGKFRIGRGPGAGADAVNEKGDPVNAEFEEAMEACRDELPQMGEELTPEERAEMEDAMLAFAQCMREHGVDMPDPGENGGIVRIAPGEDGKGGPDDPEFQAAEEACEDLLPDKGVVKERVSR